MIDDQFSLAGKRVWVAGHNGMVGSAIVRRLQSEGCTVLTAERSDCDLSNQQQVADWFAKNKPEVVVLAAAKVGGILANSSYPVDFLYDNLIIAANVVKSAYDNEVEKLLFLGSSCIYPKLAEQPIRESALLTGPLEPTNEWYAIAKITGIKLCQAYRKQYGANFISAMPPNLYGPGDNFDLNSSHVVPALMRKTHEAKINNSRSVEIWGSGKPKREFLYVDDLADGCVHLLKHYDGYDQVNIGSGEDLPISQLAQVISETVGFDGELVYDNSKPDGTPRKLMSADTIREMGWSPRVSLTDGLKFSYEWFLENVEGTA